MTGGPEVMGVLNVTPDSFSDGGLHHRPDAAVARGRELLAEGATVVDVGGESTRPGARPVDPADEAARVLPVIEQLAGPCREAGARLSVDTRHETVARQAIAAGADLLNDVSASLWPVAADLGVGWVAMHMQGDPRTMQAEPRYDDVVAHVRAFLDERARVAEAAGVPEVWVDPGIGFGKTTAHNVALLARLDRLVADGRPVVVGTSRKRSLGVLLARSDLGLPVHPGPAGGGADLELPAAAGEPVPVGSRRSGSLTTAAWAMIHGARMVRVHDVAETVRMLRTLGAGHPDEVR
ncbi:MAG: dihydropteroate synthase [Microthrixaceae bacterium]